MSSSNLGSHFEEKGRPPTPKTPSAELSVYNMMALRRTMVSSAHAGALAVMNLLVSGFSFYVMDALVKGNDLTTGLIVAGQASSGVYIGLTLCAIVMLSALPAGVLMPSVERLGTWIMWRMVNAFGGILVLCGVMVHVP